MILKHHNQVAGARFVTFCIHKQLPVLTNNVFRQFVVDSIIEAKDKFKFKILGYVIMPEHVHLVFVPAKNHKVGTIIGDIKSRSAKLILELLRQNQSPLLRQLKVIRNRLIRYVVWQRRCYDHICRTEEAVREKVNYCHNNPVKRGLVKIPGDWRWSSYRFYNGYDDYIIEIDKLE